jgi:hypothetical protein
MNNTMVGEIKIKAKINPKSPLKIRVRKISGGGNYASKYGSIHLVYMYTRLSVSGVLKNVRKKGDV